MNAEQWRAIPGYEGYYEVSDQGRVRSLDRFNWQGRRVWGRIMSPDISDSGHLRVTLSRDSRTRRFFVHGLVLSVFVGPCPPGLEACHNDGNPANNIVSNLRWDTKSANARDRRRHGTDARLRRTHCPQGHEYTEANTYLNGIGWRRCRTCTLTGQKERRDLIRGAA